MRARLAIACFSIPLLAFGFVLAVDLLTKWSIRFSAPEWGYTIFSLGADVAVVYLIVDFLLVREERERWKAVESKAIELIQSELFGVFLMVWQMLLPSVNVFTPNEEKMARMRELLTDSARLRKARNPSSVLLVEYFHEVATRLGGLQLRYSNRLDPKLIGVMIDIEKSLESMSRGLYLAKRMEGKVPSADNITTITAGGYFEIVWTLVKAVDSGVIKMPYLPAKLEL